VFLSQISTQKKAKVIYQDQQVLIEKGNKKNQWTLSTKVFSGDGKIPHSVQECISSSGTFRWQLGGAYLKVDSSNHTVSLIQTIDTSMTYIPFKEVMTYFVSVADEWREIFEDFSESVG
jgi:regulatory protein YycI of two-component signal transduction system YycFG